MVLFRTSFDRLFAVGFIVRESNGTYSYSAAEVKQEDTGPALNQELLCWRIADSLSSFGPLAEQTDL